MKGATLRDVSASLWTDNLEPGLPGRCEVNFAKNSALGSVQWTQKNKQKTAGNRDGDNDATR